MQASSVKPQPPQAHQVKRNDRRPELIVPNLPTEKQQQEQQDLESRPQQEHEPRGICRLRRGQQEQPGWQQQ